MCRPSVKRTGRVLVLPLWRMSAPCGVLLIWPIHSQLMTLAANHARTCDRPSRSELGLAR